MTKNDLINILSATGDHLNNILNNAQKIKIDNVGNQVFLRGLIEWSNYCSKDCLYCGIHSSNSKIIRYQVSDEEVLNAAQYAFEHHFGSIVVQGGELSSPQHTKIVSQLLRKIKSEFPELGITLSLGEQNKETFLEWREAGAHRYLLRIESSNPDLYYKIHPQNKQHSYEHRIESLYLLKECDYQLGSGVMIGLPFQTIEDLANDLLFFKELDIDMCGMGPYIEHEDTILYQYRHLLLPKNKRFELGLKMVAGLRLLMPDINIAATTAMQSLHPQGRGLAIKYGANVAMPNLTPKKYRNSYILYEDKPGITEDSWESHHQFEEEIAAVNCVIGYDRWGDSKHYQAKKV